MVVVVVVVVADDDVGTVTLNQQTDATHATVGGVVVAVAVQGQTDSSFAAAAAVDDGMYCHLDDRQ